MIDDVRPIKLIGPGGSLRWAEGPINRGRQVLGLLRRLVGIRSQVIRNAHEPISTLAWNKGEPPVKLLPADQGLAMLAAVGGHFSSPNEQLKLSLAKDAHYHLSGQATTPTLFAAAIAIGIPPDQLQRYTLKTFEWSAEKQPVKMIHKSEGLCFLTGVSGNFFQRKEQVRITIEDDGFWYLSGTSTRPTVEAQAMAVSIPGFARRNATFEPMEWVPGKEEIQTVHRDAGLCILTGIGGNFAGHGERVWVALREDTGFWAFGGQSGKPTLIGRVMVVRFKP